MILSEMKSLEMSGVKRTESQWKGCEGKMSKSGQVGMKASIKLILPI